MRVSNVRSARSFERIEIGDTEELTHALTAADVDIFARLTGDHNPLHLDAQFAARAGFRDPVVHGMLSAAFISTLIGMLLPGRGALWRSQTLNFLAPAFVGDTLRVCGRVKQKSPATRQLVLTITVTNQSGAELIGGEAVVVMPELDGPDPVQAHESTSTLVTGGSRGIGAAVARRLAAEGHTVAVNYLRSADEARALVAEIEAAGGHAGAFQADVADATAVLRLCAEVRAQLGPIGAIVHCAAPPNALSSFEALTSEGLRRHLDVQVGGALNCAQAALPGMVEARAGALVLIGSIAADGQPPLQQTDYVVAKAALAALARCLAAEYGPKGIRVNVVAPGLTSTDMIAHLPEKARLLAKMQAPLRRIAEPEDIAHAVAFLLTRGARHITGETLRVCGGAVMI